MMIHKESYGDKKLVERLFLPGLVFAVFAATLIDVSAPLLLTEIAATFQVKTGIASSIRSASFLAGIVFGLPLAIVSTRFKLKSLLVFGMIVECFAGIGAFLAPTLDFLNLANFFDGVGSLIVASMAYSLIGEHYPQHKRTWAIGWTVAATGLGFVIGAPIIGFIDEISSWRSTMLWFVFPVSVAALAFVYFVIPKTAKQMSISPPIFAGCKKAVSNFSVMACLIGIMLFSAASANSVFLVSFWRFQFSISTTVGSLTIFFNSLISALTGITAGRLLILNRRKPIGVIAGLLYSILVIAMIFAPIFSASYGLSAIRNIGFILATTAITGLTLDQIPKFRSSVMSLFGTFSSLGTFLGITIGGYVLDSYNYQIMAIFFGILGIASIVLIATLTKDPSNISSYHENTNCEQGVPSPH
jgi:predicted MFS family arabinose efflux permease